MANENLIEKDQIALDEPKAKKKSKKELKKEAKLAKEAEKQAKKDAKKNKKSKSQTAEVVDDKNPKKGRKKKKKSCCCRACCTMVIISLVLIVAGSAVGCYFGNQLLVENFGVKITEVFSLLGGVKNSSDRKIVKNKFSAKDYEAAEDSLKSAIFLKEDAEFSLDTLMELAIDSAIGTSDSGAKFASAQSEGKNPESTESGNAIIEYVKSALTYENIDIEKLKGYDASKIDDYKFNLTDKQLTSILQRALEKILTFDMVYDKLNASFAEMGIDAEQLSIEKIFTINQVAFNNVDGISSVKLTACFKLYSFLGKVLDNLDYSQLMGDPSIAKYGKIGAKLIKPLFAVLLPTKLYFTVEVPLKEGEAPKFAINNMSQKDVEVAFKLMDNLMSSGSGESIKDSINEPFMEGGAAYEAIKKINQEIVDLNQVITKGKMTLDVVQLGIDALKVNYEKDENGVQVPKDPSECITSHDVYNGLSLIYGTSVEDVVGEQGSKTSFNYNNIKILFDEDGNVILDEDGLPKYEFVYQYDALLIEQGKTIFGEYEKAFMQEMSNCYGLKAGATFDEIIDTFLNMDQSSTSDVFALFDTNKIKQILGGEGRGAKISDTMFAAIVNEKIGDFLGDNADFADMFELKYLILSTETDASESVDRTMAELGIYIEVQKLLKDNMQGGMAEIIAGILPKGFVISCKLDVTLSATEFRDPEIRINDSSKTQDMINVIDGLGLLGESDGQKIELGDYINDMLSPVRDALHNMSDTLPGLAIGKSKLMLPDVYDALAAFVNSGTDSENKIDSADLAQALRVLVSEAPDMPILNLTAADYEQYGRDLLAELNATLAIKNKDGNGNDYTLSAIIDELGLGGGANANKIISMIDNAKLEEIIKAVEIDRTFITDSSTNSDMAVALIRELLGEFLTGDAAQLVSAENILGITIDQEGERTYFGITLEVDIANILGETDEMMNFVLNLLPSRTVLSVKVDVTANAGTYSATDIKYNFNEDSDKVIELIEKFGVELPLGEIEDSLRNAIGELTANDMLGITLKDGGIEIDSIFGVLSNVALDGAMSEQDVKDALKVLVSEAPNKPILNLTAADYERYGRDFISELNETMAIKSKDDNGDDYTLSAIIDELGLGGEANAESIISMIDADKIKQIITASEIDRAFITDEGSDSDMMVALIREILGGYLDGEVAEFISAENVLGVNVEGRGRRTYLEITVDVNIEDLLGETDEILEFMLEMLPQRTILTISMDVTPVVGSYDRTQIIYNFNEDSQKVIELIENFGVELPTREIDEAIRGALDELTGNDMLGVTLMDGGIEIDSIFAIINNVALDTEKSEQEIKDALKVLVTDAPTNNYTQLGADDFANYGKAVINELNATMAIKIKDNQNNPYTLGAIMDELGLNGEVNTDKIMDMIDSAKLEEIINASTIDRAFITDASSSVDMVAALIREVIGDFLTGEVADLISADSVLGINVDQEADKTYLTIVVDVEIADLLGDDADEMMNFMLDLLPSQTVLTVKVDVTEGVGTYADTEIKYNFSEDSDKVMDLIEDFGVDLPTDDIATSVRDAISDFTGNDMLGVTLVDGGIEMDTVFKVINNVAFKSDLTDFEIKNVMKSVYASSDAKIDTYFADNGITIVQPSSDYTSFLGQIKSKYFIRSTLTSFDNVFDIVAAGGNTINNTNFDLDALKHTPLTIEELKPTMAYSEIGALMNEKLGGDLVVSSLNFKQVGENKYLQVYAKINLADYMGGENSFTDIISVSQLVVGIQINIGNVLTDASGKYYETTCTINDMSDVDMANLILMLKEISPDFENEIFVAVEDAGRQAYNAFSSFDENLGNNYSFTVDGLKIGDVFSFIGREMLGETTDHDAQALKVKKALQGMFASTTGSSSFNYTESNFIFNTPEAVAPELSFSLFQNGITDRQLGAYAEAKINEGGEEVGHVVQLNIISSSRTTSKTTSDVAYVNSFKSNTIGNGTYIIITDKIKLSNIVEVDDKFADLLPEEVYMTFVLKYDEANVKFDIVSYYRVNEMDAEAEETMLELIGLSMTEMDDVMMDNAGKCIKPINDLFDVVESMVPVSGITLVHNFAEITDTATTARGKFFVSF